MPRSPAPSDRPDAPAADGRAGERIAKLLARAGIASRREVERMIAEGRVARDGVPVDTPATLLVSLAGVTVDGQPVAAPAPARLFVYHKPVGLLVTERDPAGRPTIYDRLPAGLPRVVPVGRLDLATEGLLLLTTDGGLKRQLELPATGVERTYRARAYGPVSQDQLEALIEGVEIDGMRYGSIDANLERRTGANTWIEMTLTEGKNREVRRVLEHLGLQVGRLIRTRYGPFVLADLPPGEVGEVRPQDLAAFRQTLKQRPGTADQARVAVAAASFAPARMPAEAAAAPNPSDAARAARARPTPDRTNARPQRSRDRDERPADAAGDRRPASRQYGAGREDSRPSRDRSPPGDRTGERSQARRGRGTAVAPSGEEAGTRQRRQTPQRRGEARPPRGPAHGGNAGADGDARRQRPRSDQTRSAIGKGSARSSASRSAADGGRQSSRKVGDTARPTRSRSDDAARDAPGRSDRPRSAPSGGERPRSAGTRAATTPRPATDGGKRPPPRPGGGKPTRRGPPRSQR